jgi:hypothetical protein
MVANRVQVKAFKDVNAMGAFLGKQNDNSWKDTGVAGLKSGKYKIDMVSKGGKPAKNFIKMNEEAEQLDELGNKYVMDKKDLAAVQSKLNTMKNPPKVIKDKAGYFHLKNGNSTTGPFSTMKDVLKNLGETN